MTPDEIDVTIQRDLALARKAMNDLAFHQNAVDGLIEWLFDGISSDNILIAMSCLLLIAGFFLSVSGVFIGLGALIFSLMS